MGQNSKAAARKSSGHAGKEKMMFHLMLLLGMIMLAIFEFVPLFGMIMAFENCSPA